MYFPFCLIMHQNLYKNKEFPDPVPGKNGVLAGEGLYMCAILLHI